MTASHALSQLSYSPKTARTVTSPQMCVNTYLSAVEMVISLPATAALHHRNPGSGSMESR